MYEFIIGLIGWAVGALMVWAILEPPPRPTYKEIKSRRDIAARLEAAKIVKSDDERWVEAFCSKVSNLPDFIVMRTMENYDWKELVAALSEVSGLRAKLEEMTGFRDTVREERNKAIKLRDEMHAELEKFKRQNEAFRGEIVSLRHTKGENETSIVNLEAHLKAASDLAARERISRDSYRYECDLHRDACKEAANEIGSLRQKIQQLSKLRRSRRVRSKAAHRSRSTPARPAKAPIPRPNPPVRSPSTRPEPRRKATRSRSKGKRRR